MVEFNKDNLALARRAAAEGMVLLRNDNGVLPLSKDKKVALFGRNQFDVFKGGGGAADLWAVRVFPFADGMNEAGNVYQPLLKKYKAYSEANCNRILNKIHSHYTWSLQEIPLKDEEVKLAADECDTAVIFIGRFAAEGFDIKDSAGQYRITGAEDAMLRVVTKYFSKVVLVLNVPSTMDMLFLDNYKIDAILHAFLPGMEAGHAVSDVLYGDVTPSGKLPDSFAKRCYEYPSNDETFGTDKVVYSEGLYMGYRYFDTFEKEVLFPFGFGLSYTDFEVKTNEVCLKDTVIEVKAAVKNIGKMSGRQTVQCYLSIPDGKLDQPYQVLCGFEKTALLAPGESEELSISIDLTDFASYDEEKAEYILEKGNYILRVGVHSRDTEAVATVVLDETAVCRRVKNRLVPKEEINELKKEKRNDNKAIGRVLVADMSAFTLEDRTSDICVAELQKTGDFTFEDLMKGRCTAEELVACFDDEELARLLTADGGQKRRALGIECGELAAGEGTHTHPDAKYKIPASVMQDGPAGVRASSFWNPVPPDDEIVGRDCIAYPCATLLAATWDRALQREIGAAIVEDMDRYRYNGLCAPGVNLHRNPRCGRNFEYFSEDPFLSAQMASGQIIGIQQKSDGEPSGRYAVLKHFACNNAEDGRLDGDSVLSERCARELYLKAFEYTIALSQPHSIMSAYNMVNGEFASANPDLLDGICRNEWRYEGWIMTDWSVHAPSIDCIKAGADTVMPGTYISAEEMREGGISRALAQRRVVRLIKHLSKTVHHKV